MPKYNIETFNPKLVTQRYKFPKILEAHEKGLLIDFMKPCREIGTEMAILDSWAAHFKAAKEPFCVQRIGKKFWDGYKRYTIWKIQKV